MTTFRTILESNARATGDEILTIGQIALGAGAADRLGSKILLHILETYPDANQGEIEDALQAALWWLMFNAGVQWAAQESEAR